MAITLPANVTISTKVEGGTAVDQLKSQVADLQRSTSGLAKGFSGAASAAKLFFQAYVASKGVEFIKNIIDQADQLHDLSQNLGVSANSLSKLKTAAELSGLQFDQLIGGIRKLNVSIAESAAGNGKAGAAFSQLGINVKTSTGQLKSADQVLFEISDKFKNLKDGPQKAADAVRIFGKSGADLISMLNEGSDQLKKFGLNLDDNFVNRADAFKDTITILTVQLQNLAVVGIGQSLLPALQEISTAFTEIPADGKETLNFFDLLASAARYVSIGIYAIVETATQAADAVKTSFSAIADNIEALGQESVALAHLNFSQVSAIIDATNKKAAQDDDAYEERFNKRISDFSTFSQKIIKNDALLGGFFGGADSLDARRTQSQLDTAVAPKAKGLGALGVNDDALAGHDAAIKAAQKELEAINAQTDALGKNEVERQKINALKELDQHQTELGTAAYQKYKQAILDAIDAQEKQRQAVAANPWIGAKQGLDDYIKSIDDLNTQAKGLVTNTLKGLEDAFTSFFTTGKFQWKQFATAIIEEITRIAVRKAIIEPIANAAGGLLGAIKFANGGIMTGEGSVPLKKYASGGIANNPQVALFGEGSKPEAYVPLPDGRSIPVNMKGGGSGGDTNVTVHVNTQDGSSKVTSDADQAAKLGRMVANVVKGEIVKQKRPGGLFYG